MKRWPLKQRVIVDATLGGVDYSNVPGSELLGSNLWSVPVYAWEVVKSDRMFNEGQAAVADLFRVYAPPGLFAHGQRIGDTEELGWTVEGNPVDHNHGPGWSPGLVVYEATRVIYQPY